jgi:hypothetical protein
VAPCWNVSWKSDETTLELEHVLRTREKDADKEPRERERPEGWCVYFRVAEVGAGAKVGIADWIRRNDTKRVGIGKGGSQGNEGVDGLFRMLEPTWKDSNNDRT